MSITTTSTSTGSTSTMPKLDDLSAPDDNTDRNASTSAHGLLPKLPNVATQFLTGTGTWATPAGDTASGTYTPTRSAEANTDSNVTMAEAQYQRVGSVVTVSGRFTLDPTLTATATSFEMTLPIASDLGAAEDLAGVAFCGGIAALGAEIIGSVANNTAVVFFISSDVTSKTWSYLFSYSII